MRNKEGLVDDLITSIPGEWKFVLQRYVFYTTASVFAQDYSVKSPTALCDAEDFRYF